MKTFNKTIIIKVILILLSFLLISVSANLYFSEPPSPMSLVYIVGIVFGILIFGLVLSYHKEGL